MDPRDIQQHLQQPPPGMLMSHNNSFNRNPNAAAALMGHTSTSQAMHQRLPFGSLSPHQPQQQQHHYHHPQPQQQMDQKTLESLGFDGSSSSVAATQQQQSMRFGIEQQQQVKKKRGRPRKYADGVGGSGGSNIALGLAPTSPHPSASNSYGGDSGGVNVNSSDPPAKRNRGRPPGSGKKQLEALGGTGGVGFTPHVIEVLNGEDIAKKIMAFTNQGPRTICILSATGVVSNVVLRQANNPDGIVKYEGRYDIVSLAGSFLNTESNGTMTKSGSLSVSLAGQDGLIVGGLVEGMLVAASQVQVIVGSFVTDGKKKKQAPELAQNTPKPASAPANMLSFGGGGGGGRPGSPRQQQHSGETSEENESNSPVHRGNNNNNNNNHGLFGNSTQHQPLHQMQHMPMYHPWPNQNPQ